MKLAVPDFLRGAVDTVGAERLVTSRGPSRHLVHWPEGIEPAHVARITKRRDKPKDFSRPSKKLCR